MKQKYVTRNAMVYYVNLALALNLNLNMKFKITMEA
jgi:hypothetical protein